MKNLFTLVYKIWKIPSSNLAGVMDEGKVSLGMFVHFSEAFLRRLERTGPLDLRQEVIVLLVHRVIPHSITAVFINDVHKILRIFDTLPMSAFRTDLYIYMSRAFVCVSVRPGRFLRA